jgi:Chaperone of endosialidase
MRRIVLAGITGLTILVVGWLLPSQTSATPLSAPGGLGVAIADISLTEQVYWRRWGWRRCCWRRWGYYRWHRWGWRRWGWRRSDMQLKDNIVRVGTLDSGIGIYRFNYKDEDQTAYVGVLAQEVQKIMPSAVARASDGYLSVDYGRLGFRFMSWDEWQEQNAVTRLSTR